MSFFERHLFVCTNARKDPCKQSCNDYGEAEAKQLDLIGAGKLRISGSGCLGRCEKGPAMVIYPEGRWYTYVDEQDLQDILQEDLVNKRVVERLLID